MSKYSKIDRDERTDVMNEDCSKFIEELTSITDEAKQSEKFQEWLETKSKFHDYSWQNTLLICMQKPDAKRVAGYQQWQKKFDRHVKKGEDAIWILAPQKAPRCPACSIFKNSHDTEECPYFDKDDDSYPVLESEDDINWEYFVYGFRPVSVFDVSQTEGEPLPELDHDAKPDDRDGKELMEKAKEVAEEFGIDFEYKSPEEWNKSSKGYAIDRKARTLKREPAATAKTAVHEIGHILAGHTENNKIIETEDKRSEKEVVAESIAYIVGKNLGLDVSNSKFYLAAWEGDEETFKDKMQEISNTSKQILEKIEEKL